MNMQINRRHLLQSIGAGWLALYLGGCGGAAEAPAKQKFFERIGKPIGLQLYALGDEIRADLPGTFRAVAAMGYGEVELPSLLGSTAPELKAMADAASLKISSLHVPARAFVPGDGLTFEAEPDIVAETATALGITHLVIPFPLLPTGFAIAEGEGFPQAIERTFRALGADHWKATATRFNEIGAAMQERGLTVAYHNHNLEFAPGEGGRAWDILVAETDPALVKLQLDLGWIVTAGEDPLAMLNAHKGRITSLHVKDVAADNQPGFWFGMSPTQVGSGTLDWATLLPAAAEAGVQHYFVEQEPPFAMPRPEAMQKSADYLKNLEA